MLPRKTLNIKKQHAKKCVKGRLQRILHLNFALTFSIINEASLVDVLFYYYLFNYLLYLLHFNKIIKEQIYSVKLFIVLYA